jgi:hypothetical protein
MPAASGLLFLVVATKIIKDNFDFETDAGH